MTSCAEMHLRLPPSNHEASVGAEKLSFGKTVPPSSSIASSICRSRSTNCGRAGASQSSSSASSHSSSVESTLANTPSARRCATNSWLTGSTTLLIETFRSA
eukprot:2910602-Prymnesium_polylepis.1